MTEGKRRAQGEGVLAGTHDFAPCPIQRSAPSLLLFFFLDAISPTRSYFGYP